MSNRKETTTTSLSDLIHQDGVRLLLEEQARRAYIDFSRIDHGKVTNGPPWYRRMGAWLEWRWWTLRERVGYWIAGHNPDDEDRW